MAKNRLRKLAKKVGSQPRFKKMIANYIVDWRMTHEEWTEEYKREVILMGHRGLLAMSEADLTKEFDIVFEKASNKYERLVKKEITTWSSNGRRGYSWKDDKEHLKEGKEFIDKGDSIYLEIFEKEFL